MLLTKKNKNVRLNLKNFSLEALVDLIDKTEKQYHAKMFVIHVSESIYRLIPDHVVRGTTVYQGGGFTPGEVVLSLTE